MQPRQRHIIRVLSSVCVGSIAFCITLLVVFLVGSILLSLLELMKGDGFFSPESVILFLISTLVALIIAVVVGIKYAGYVKNQNEYTLNRR